MDNLVFFILGVLPTISLMALAIKDLKIQKNYSEKISENNFLSFIGLFFIVKVFLILAIFPFERFYIREVFIFFYSAMLLYLTKKEWSYFGLFLGILILMSFFFEFYLIGDTNFIIRIVGSFFEILLLLINLSLYFLIRFLFKKNFLKQKIIKIH